jgi:hypothetical protein
MKSRNALIALGIAAALAAGAAAFIYTASAQGGPGWMMGGGYGPGYHMRGWGSGPGRGEGSWDCPGVRQNDQPGTGQGYGPGYHMRGWGGGYGPGMMGGNGPGYGPGYGPRGAAQGDQNANQNLTTDDVKTRVERWLAWRGNPRLKVGEVKEKDADTIFADVVTKDNSLVQRFIIDRHTGAFRQDNS